MRSGYVLLASALMFVLAIVVALTSSSCSASNLPAPDYMSHPTSALVEVPYPPPPGRVEVIPKRPSSKHVWIDGEWLWQTGRWAWKPGRWVVAPSNGVKFAPWTSVRDRTGTLYVAAGTWRDPSGKEVLEPEPAIPGKPPPVAIVNPEGEEVPHARIVRPNDGTRGNGREDLDASAAAAIVALDAAAHAPDTITFDASSPPWRPTTLDDASSDASTDAGVQ